jgi:hypothetical protein
MTSVLFARVRRVRPPIKMPKPWKDISLIGLESCQQPGLGFAPGTSRFYQERLKELVSYLSFQFPKKSTSIYFYGKIFAQSKSP